MSRPAARGPRALAVLIAGVGVVLTCLATWTLARVDANSEHRLLQGQTDQVGSVLSTALTVVEQPLATALSVQEVAGSGNGSAFAEFMSPSVGEGKPFASASLWERDEGGLRQVATTGAAPALTPDSAEVLDIVGRSFRSSTPTAQLLTAGERRLVAWAKGDPATGFAVYAELALPADRRSPVDSDSAYAGLHYAAYFGERADTGSVMATDVDPDSLPLDGDTARTTLRFGDTKLTLVTAAREHLGSTLSQWLPLGVLIGGLLLTALAALTGLRLARGRRDAEQDAATITELYERVETLYAQQRDLFERLQRALLPRGDMSVPDLEVAAQYVAGAQGTEIGGDWYSLVPLDEDRYAFVVGDVSGRGVDTVAVMAKARFTVRAYLIDGHCPAVALEKCSRQFDIVDDGHLTTVVVGVGSTRTGEVAIASAGHLPPILLGRETRALEIPPGRPLGAGTSRYEQATFHLDVGETLFCYTDGLVERRGEPIDAGLDRLAATLSGAGDLRLDALVAHVVETLSTEGGGDDIAALALRRAGAR
jgi:serine phosphatase RsbU (regulator of sigma subunit)